MHMDRIFAIKVLVVAVAVLAIVSSLFGKFILSAAFLAIVAALFVAARKLGNSAKAVDNQLIRLLDDAFSKDSGIPIIRCIRDSNKKEYIFHDALESAIRAHALSGDTSRFAALGRYQSRHLERFALMLSHSLEHARDISKELSEFRAELVEDERQRRRLRAQIDGAAAISHLGTMLFFPLFAGVSIQIMRFASSYSVFRFSSVFPVLAFYIVAANLIGFEYSDRDSISVVSDAAASAAAAFFVFSATNIVANLMLR